MKVGVSAFAWTTNLTEAHIKLIPKLRENGIEGFEIPMFDPADVAATELRRAFDASGMECTVCAILPAGINPISTDASVRKQSLAHLVRCIETAAETGAHLICGPVYAPIGYFSGRRRTEDEWNMAVECIQALGDALATNDVILGVEPVNRSETHFLNTAVEAKDFCEAITNPRIGITIDTFHANIEEKSIVGAVKSAGKHLKHLHASENDRGLLGSGHVDFPGIVDALRGIDYEGFLMIEGFGYSPDEPASLGALWGDLAVSPEDIAFKGTSYLRGVLATAKANAQRGLPMKSSV
jgi:D-psicose/D-tagatose/L-ribulose 3-epimerase